MNKHVFGLLLLFVSSLVTVAKADPYGSQFQVNTLPLSSNASPNVIGMSQATGANGDSMLLWWFGDIANPTVYFQRYDAAGLRLQSQEWSAPNVLGAAVSANGSYALLRKLPDRTGHALYVTVYNRSGGVLVPQFQVNDYAAQAPLIYGAGIKMNASGQLLVSWTSGSSGTPGSPTDTVYVKRFHANGTAATAQIMLYANTNPYQGYAGGGLALDASGNFVVSWSFGDIYTADSMDIWARRFNANGTALGSAFRVNTTTAGKQISDGLAMNDAGAFVVLWEGPNGSGGIGLFAQRYSSAGTPLGGEFAVNTQAARFSTGFDGTGISMAPNGSFVATWNDGLTVFARAFRADGTAFAAPFVVASPGNLWTRFANVGLDRNNNFLISWMQFTGSDSNSDRVYARRYWPADISVQTAAVGQTVTPLSGTTGSWRYFKVTVPPGYSTFDFSIFGGTGDADIYVRWGVLPTFTEWNGRPYLWGNNETARMSGAIAGDWYVGIYGYNGYNSLGFRPSF